MEKRYITKEQATERLYSILNSVIRDCDNKIKELRKNSSVSGEIAIDLLKNYMVEIDDLFTYIEEINLLIPDKIDLKYPPNKNILEI
jgi:hypothetical protein